MNNITFKDAYGFHTVDQLSAKNLIKGMDGDNLSTFNGIKNISTLVGYIPGIATIVAIVKAVFTEIALYYAHKTLEETPWQAKQLTQVIDFLEGQRVRNLVELTSLGLFLLIPDLIITHQRNKIDNESQDSYELQPVSNNQSGYYPEYNVQYSYNNQSYGDDKQFDQPIEDYNPEQY